MKLYLLKVAEAFEAQDEWLDGDKYEAFMKKIDGKLKPGAKCAWCYEEDVKFWESHRIPMFDPNQWPYSGFIIPFPETEGRSEMELNNVCLVITDYPIEKENPETDWCVLAKPRQFTVCICGSSRFADYAAVAQWEFEKLGVLALGMHYLPGWYTPHEHHLAEHEGVAHILDELHLRKIEKADFVYVVNQQGYIGIRTTFEISHAKSLARPIYFSESFSPVAALTEFQKTQAPQGTKVGGAA